MPDDLDYEDLELRTADGLSLHCYFLPAGQPRVAARHCQVRARCPAFNPFSDIYFQDYTRAGPRATVIMFHGNGYHIWHHIHSGKEFVRLGCNVLLVSYRGQVQRRSFCLHIHI